MILIEKIIKEAIEKDASDIHLINGMKPILRITRALVELEEEGLLYTERTNGKYVTTDSKLINQYKTKYVKELTREYISNMENIGISREEIKKYIEMIGEQKWMN